MITIETVFVWARFSLDQALNAISTFSQNLSMPYLTQPLIRREWSFLSIILISCDCHIHVLANYLFHAILDFLCNAHPALLNSTKLNVITMVLMGLPLALRFKKSSNGSTKRPTVPLTVQTVRSKAFFKTVFPVRLVTQCKLMLSSINFRCRYNFRGSLYEIKFPWQFIWKLREFADRLFFPF